jgi:Flp pilus assembly CpaE family ATPase
VVLNRSNSRVGLGSKDVEDLLGVQIKAEVPSSGAVPAALNSGKTMWESQADHPVSLAIAQLARTITGEKVAKPAKERSWFARNKKK